MIPNAWVSYKLTKKAYNKGMTKGGKANTPDEEEELELWNAAIAMYRGAAVLGLLWMFFIFLNVIGLIPEHIGSLGQNWTEYTEDTRPYEERWPDK